MSAPVIGWDVGGAHLKRAVIDAGGRLLSAEIVPCPLWRGLGELDAALAALGDGPPEAASAITMTGELVDLFPDRAEGVAALARRMAERLAGPAAIYAGDAGFLAPAATAGAWALVASANWRATAEALAADGGAGLLVDIGSTTADIVPFADGRPLATGASDFERMAADELVYLGAARTPVMAIATRLPFAGRWIAPMAEHFATTADVFRLTGELPDGADLHEAADGGPKTAEASARRLLRMVGLDLTPETGPQARALAGWLSAEIVRRLRDAASGVLARTGRDIRTVYGAGVGRFLGVRVARRLGLVYRDVGSAWADDPALAAAAADCAPAVAVARLYGRAVTAPERTIRT